MTSLHFVVINKRQTRTSDKLEKCVQSVVLLCSKCRNVYRTRGINFCFHVKKNAAQSLRETYGVRAQSQDMCERWIRRFKSGDFDTRQEGRQGTWKIVKTFEYVELQSLVDKNDSQTQKQLAEQLDVSQQTVSNRLLEMGKIQNIVRWVPHDLNDRQMKKR